MRHVAAQLGVDVVAFASAEPFKEFSDALVERSHLYVESRGAPLGVRTRLEALRLRAEPAARMPGARSIILLGVYNNDDVSWLAELGSEPRGRIARRYSYFKLVEQAATQLVDFLRQSGHSAILAEDSVPIKPALVRSGLAWFGKNTLTYVDGYGSWIDWLPILTDAELAEAIRGPANRAHPRCENCQACLEACPSGALYEPFKLDPDRCVSSISRYEHEVAAQARPWMGAWLCGCDICQEVCPINREAKPRRRPLQAKPSTYGGFSLPPEMSPRPALIPLLKLDEPQYRSLKRNAIIALGNLRSTEALPELERIARDPASSLNEYAQWAIEAIRR
ncbi:MAG: 4Fe-4S double cluster binding domain-containing protein [Candidatus Bathyarchaeia archaeon]